MDSQDSIESNQTHFTMHSNATTNIQNKRHQSFKAIEPSKLAQLNSSVDQRDKQPKKHLSDLKLETSPPHEEYELPAEFNKQYKQPQTSTSGQILTLNQQALLSFNRESESFEEDTPKFQLGEPQPKLSDPMEQMS